MTAHPAGTTGPVQPPALTALAARFGTPLYAYRLPAARSALAELRAALPDPAALYYSAKANPHPELIGELVRGGCRVEVSSSDELEAALAAGADAQDCLHTGPGKTAAELAHAVHRGVRRFSVESAAQLRAVDQAAADAGARVRCLLRINAEHGASGGIRMTGKPSQFGIDLALLRQDPTPCAHRGAAEVVGAHLFPVSNAADPEALLAAFGTGARTAALLHAEHGLPLRELDLGGGFSAPYARPGALPRYGAEFRDRAVAILDEVLPGWRRGAPEIAFESGRHLAGGAGELLVSVVDVKTSGGRAFAVLDAGINQVGGLSGLGRMLPAAIVPEPVEPRPGTVRPVDLVGPLCTPADVLGRGVELPPLHPGDLLRIPNVGAYGLTASPLGFLSRPAPAEVVLDGSAVVSATALRLRRDDLLGGAR